MSESEPTIFNVVELGGFDNFAKTFFKIAEEKYTERNLAVGMAAGYVDDQGIVHTVAKEGNPLGRHSWTSLLRGAMGNLVSTLSRQNNRQYGGVILFNGAMPSGISICSSDGKGPEEKDSARDLELVTEIMTLTMESLGS